MIDFPLQIGIQLYKSIKFSLLKETTNMLRDDQSQTPQIHHCLMLRLEELDIRQLLIRPNKMNIYWNTKHMQRPNTRLQRVSFYRSDNIINFLQLCSTMFDCNQRQIKWITLLYITVVTSMTMLVNVILRYTKRACATVSLCFFTLLGHLTVFIQQIQ